MAGLPFALTLAAALALPAPQTADPEMAALTRRLEEIVPDAAGVVGVSLVHHESGRAASLRGSEGYLMASTYKVPIAVAVLRRVEAGAVRLSQWQTVEQGDLREGGFETLKKMWKPGLALSLGDLLELMLVESDNSATDVLFRVLGGPAAVARTLAELGVAGIEVNRTERELDADSSDPKFGHDGRDTATPEAMTRLLVRLHRRELLSEPMTALVLDGMRRCKTGDNRLRALLPPGTEVLDKTGSANGTTNDVGIVTLPDGSHLAISVFVTDSKAEAARREKVIARIGRASWDAFQPRSALAR
jgi:beta-lactamase class A